MQTTCSMSFNKPKDHGNTLTFIQTDKEMCRKENEHGRFWFLVQLWPQMKAKVIQTYTLVDFKGVYHYTKFERNHFEDALTQASTIFF